MVYVCHEECYEDSSIVSTYNIMLSTDRDRVLSEYSQTSTAFLNISFRFNTGTSTTACRRDADDSRPQHTAHSIPPISITQ